MQHTSLIDFLMKILQKQQANTLNILSVEKRKR
jgi:hypothetical protein